MGKRREGGINISIERKKGASERSKRTLGGTDSMGGAEVWAL
jgi:hypothetical protein